MQSRMKVLLGTLVLCLASAVRGDDLYTVVTVGASEPTAISLTNAWDKVDVAPVAVAYSAVGWDRTERSEDGSTVVLALEPVDGTAGAVTLAQGLTGKSSYSWTPSGLETKLYRLSHYVIKDGATNAAETLEAFFDFANNPYLRISDEQVIEAMSAANTGSFTIVNDKANPWLPISLSAREGVSAPQGASSTFDIIVTHTGEFSFDWVFVGGTASVSVDGGAAQTLTEGEQSLLLSVIGRGSHVIRFTVTLGSADSFTLKNVAWHEKDSDLAQVLGGAVRVDLREGERTVRHREDILPFVYSLTNFTGCVGADETSLARVTVVQVTGNEEEDVTSWTNVVNEVAGTARVLVSDVARESTVLWHPAAAGFWKATFEIRTDGEVVHRENAFFDLRKYRGFGLRLIIR